MDKIQQALRVIDDSASNCKDVEERKRRYAAAATLRAELAGMKADAERYRWLVDAGPDAEVGINRCIADSHHCRVSQFYYKSGDEISTFIDEHRTALDRARSATHPEQAP